MCVPACQDACRDFPDSAHLVQTRAQVQLEDHEIGPAMWAASMAATQMPSFDDESPTWTLPSSPRRTPDKLGKVSAAVLFTPVEVQQPDAASTADDGDSAAAAAAVAAAAATVSAYLSAGGAAKTIEKRGQEEVGSDRPEVLLNPVRRRRPPGGGQQGVHGGEDAADGVAADGTAAGVRVAVAGPIAEAVVTGADGVGDDARAPPAVALTTADATSLDGSAPNSPRHRRHSFSSSEDSLCEALLQKPATAPAAGPEPRKCSTAQGYAPQTNRSSTVGGQQRGTLAVAAGASNRMYFQSPSLSHTTALYGTHGGAAPPVWGERLLLPPRSSGRGSNMRRQNSREADPRCSTTTGELSGSHSQSAASGRFLAEAEASQGGRVSSGAASFLQALLPFRMTSTRPRSPSPSGSPVARAGTPPLPPQPQKQQQQLRQQPHLQQQPQLPGSAFINGIDMKDLASLERLRFSSQRPADAYSVVRYLSKRARLEAGGGGGGGTGGVSTRASSTVVPGLTAGPVPVAYEDKSARCGVAAYESRSVRGDCAAAPEFDLSELEEIAASTSGQHRIPTASQFLFLTPQPFLGIDPLAPLFDASGQAPNQAPNQAPTPLDARRRPRPAPWNSTVNGDRSDLCALHELSAFGGPAEDGSTRHIGGPTGRRSMHTRPRGSGGLLMSGGGNVTSLGGSPLKFASDGAAERNVEEWLSDPQSHSCHDRCVKLEKQVAVLRRQLAASEARVESILEDPFKVR